MSARVPLWLKLPKVQHIQVIPERPAIVKKIFEWAAKGLGQYLICDKLLAPILRHGDRFTRQASAVIALLCQCHSQLPKCRRGIPAPHKEIDRLPRGFGGQSHPIPSTNRLKKTENTCPFFRGKYKHQRTAATRRLLKQPTSRPGAVRCAA